VFIRKVNMDDHEEIKMMKNDTKDFNFIHRYILVNNQQPDGKIEEEVASQDI
jgi:hypothetical protein